MERRNSTNSHGTAVAGIIGADRFGGPAIGVAFDARIVGVDHFDAGGNECRAPGRCVTRRAFGRTSHIVNHSFSFRKLRRLERIVGRSDLVCKHRRRSPGRPQRLGTIIVQSASNGRDDCLAIIPIFNANTNHSILTNNEFSIVVASVKQNGTVTVDSTPGSSILVSAFGEGNTIRTTDRTGTDGFDAGDYTNFGGTSAAAPQVSGIVALMLEANRCARLSRRPGHLSLLSPSCRLRNWRPHRRK